MEQDIWSGLVLLITTSASCLVVGSSICLHGSAGWCHTVTPSLLFSLSQELYERCDKLRRSAFKMATEAEDNDASLGLPLAVTPSSLLRIFSRRSVADLLNPFAPQVTSCRPMTTSPGSSTRMRRLLRAGPSTVTVKSLGLRRRTAKTVS